MSDRSYVDPYDELFGDTAVADAWSMPALVQRMLDFEAALADAEAEAGIVPLEAVASIRRAASADLYDCATLAREAAVDGNLAIPLVRQLTARVAGEDRHAAGFVHWGATSQDVLDTAVVLQLQATVPRVVDHLHRGMSAAARHARNHIDTVMTGRTLLQQATPVTFGLKLAGWLDALQRVRASVVMALDAARVLQFGGAAGTLAALGDRGPRVAELLGQRLGLQVPDVPWHAHRDRLARLACELGLVCGVCGKVARDLSLLSQTEVGEAAETRATGGGSSTMPHKRNPVWASVALAAAARAPGLVATMLIAMPQEHERGLGGWHAEWSTLPELVKVTAGAARATAEALDGLSVDPERMRANLNQSGGLAMAEAITMRLAQRIGRAEAFQLVAAATRSARNSGSSLEETLAADERISRDLTRDEIRAALAPENYLGAARTFIARVLSRCS